jgi:hypothetical protein
MAIGGRASMARAEGGNAMNLQDYGCRSEQRSRRAARLDCVTLAILVAHASLLACSAPAPDREMLGGPVAGAPAVDAGVIPETTVCAADNPFCQTPPLITPTSTGTAPVPTTTNCGSVPIDLRPSGVNIMLAIDGAAGMATHWADVATAIRSLRENNPTASFGMQSFWADAIDLASGQTNMNTSNNGCAQVHNTFLELGTHTSEALVTALGSAPRGGTIMDLYQVSPVIEPLSFYLTNASKLADPTRTNYLLVFTGGNDNCFGSAFADKSSKLIAYQKLAVELSKLNIRTIPIGVDPPGAAMGMPIGPVGSAVTSGGFFGIGATTMAPSTDYEALGALLKYGGSGLAEVPRIDTPAKLAELVSQVGSTVNNCRFEIPAALDSSAAVNPFELSFSINSKVVPRDRHQLNGWDFVNASTNQVEFFGQGCQALQAGQSLVADKSCEQNVCGTAAVSAQTKPRTVLLLLDSSLSRTECADGSIDCVTMTPGTPGRPLTFWETVQNAVGAALGAPVNDDVAFGIQFFPSKMAETFSCDVGAQPEIPPAPGAQIAIMKQMLEKFPLGLSPVVGVMESVAAAPGKLADPNAIGSVVLLSDGGDNCSGAAQQEIVTRLGTAAKKLFDAGVKTYAIRYGSADSETPEQAEQLTAIVTNGGTTLTGAKVPYIDAKSPDELSSALAALSDRLASCSFPLEGLKPDIDKNRTNLFLNGEQIGFDAKGTKADGWNWVNPERTVVELYGDACTVFKTSRRTRVAVEFGCEPVVVMGPE